MDLIWRDPWFKLDELGPLLGLKLKVTVIDHNIKYVFNYLPYTIDKFNNRSDA